MHFPSSDNPWEEAFLKQSYDAAVGRLFRGLIHNLNGALQAVFMQSELMAMMLGQSLELARKLQQPLPEEAVRECGATLQEAVERRLQGLTGMREKILLSQQVMRRTLVLPDFKKSVQDEEYTVNSAVRTELEFLAADPFFKHKVKKEVSFGETLPPLQHMPVELHQILYAALANAVESMEGSGEEPLLSVVTSSADGTVTIAVQDSGPGIKPEDQEHIFEPFFTTKNDHLGLGLYLARKLVYACGGEIACQSKPGETRFVITLPSDRI